MQHSTSGLLRATKKEKMEQMKAYGESGTDSQSIITRGTGGNKVTQSGLTDAIFIAKNQ